MAEVIKKRVLLTEAINRTASLLPYINSNTTDKNNWGKVVYDLNYNELPNNVKSVINKSTTVKVNDTNYNILYYKTLLKHYFILRDLIEGGTILRKTSTGYWKPYTRDDINTLDVAYDIYSGKTTSAIYTDNLSNNITEALEIEDLDTFNSNGGLTLFFFVRNEIIGYIKVDSDITGIHVPEYITYSEIAQRLEVLNKMKNPATCCAENIFESYGGQKMINFLNRQTTYAAKQNAQKHYCEPYAATVPNMTVSLALFQEVLPLGEAMEDEIGTATTTNDTIGWYSGNTPVAGKIESKLSRVERRKRAFADNGTELPFALVNGAVEPVYKTKIAYNKHENNGTVYADVLTDMIVASAATTTAPGVMTFKYTLQGEWNEATSSITNGIKYEENFPYEIKSITATIGGNARTYQYSAITYENNEVTIYNEDNGLSIDSYIADASWNVHDIWHQSGYTENPIYREDYMLGVATPFNVDVDVTVDRGKASAFERYMIMAECNTMEDLYNYKNNFFNL